MKLLQYFLILGCVLGSLSAGRDFYKILQVKKSASGNEIKKAYRKLAKELHPDKMKGKVSDSSKFQDLGAAYEVLSDPEKRKLYDRCGEECLKKVDSSDQEGDLFQTFFQDFGFPFGGNESPQQESFRGADITIETFVTLEELYSGTFVQLVRNKPVLQPASGTRECNCRDEMVTKKLGFGAYQLIQETVCDKCPNVQYVEEERILEIEIEPGMADGSEMRYMSEGEPHIDGDPGDLIIVVRQTPHDRFYRKGCDLYTNVTISLQNALIGFELDIPHLDGHNVTISKEDITWPGFCIEKKNEGMPCDEIDDGFGKLFITFNVDFPKKHLNQTEKEFIKQILEQDSINRIYNGL